MTTATTRQVLSEEAARSYLAEGMPQLCGVPCDWWGEDDEIAVFTNDPNRAVLAADALCRRDLGDGYLTAFGGIEVSGPGPVVLIEDPAVEQVLFAPAGPGQYRLPVCVVSPTRGEVT